MDCKEAQELLSVYSDNELDLIRSLEMENHLQQCLVCSEKLNTYGAMHELSSAGSLYYTAPAGLRDRVQASLRKEQAGAPKSARKNLQWLAYAASFAIVFFLGWMAGGLRSPATESTMDQEILSSHVRSLMPGHLTDVASSNQHTVKPWFNGKIDFSPTVTDFAAEGYPLIGGRLDYLNHRSVVVLVYARNKHFINVYLWPATGQADKDLGVRTLQGYHIVGWTSSGTNYYAISDLNEKELADFVKLLRSR